VTTSDGTDTNALGQDRSDDLLGALLVLVVEEREQERHDDGVEAALGEQLGSLFTSSSASGTATAPVGGMMRSLTTRRLRR